VWDLDPYAPPRDYPAGTVLMFMGDSTARDAAYPPALWQVCDGTNGTYDMRGRIPIGVSASIDPGEEVGSESGPYTTSENGAHDHTGATGGTSITEAQLPEHLHFCAYDVEGSLSTLVSATLSMQRASSNGGDTEYRLRGTASAAQIPDVAPSSPVGSGDAHTHTISEDGDHTHTVSTGLPPCTGLWFLMRKA
jgi:hypothetical protein